MPQSEIISLWHIGKAKKIKYKIIQNKNHRAAGQISRQATGKRPGAPNGQSVPDLNSDVTCSPIEFVMQKN